MSFDKYEHKNVENKIYDYWEKNELFKPKENSKKFSIVIPPPNVTGSLRMGCLLYTSPSPRDAIPSRMPSSA